MRASVYRHDDIAPLATRYENSRFVARATCAACGAHKDWSAQNQPPPDLVRKKFLQMGWRVDRKATCPECLQKPKREKQTVKPAPATVTPIKASNDAPDQAKAARNKRAVIIALEDYFDEATRRYRGENSDNTVAKELGLSPDFVAAVREEFFGPIGEPDEITALRADLEKADRELDELGVQMSAVGERIAAIEEKLNALALKNGWRV